MNRNVYFVTIDVTGHMKKVASLPESRFPPQIGEEDRIVVPEDRQIPRHDFRVDLRKVRKKINYVRSIASVCAVTKPLPERVLLEISRDEALDRIDRSCADRVAMLRGPLADIHAQKRRQAEAGSGPLIADEADRLAILAKAAAEDEAVAAIERERREIKAALRAATSEDEIKAIMAELHNRRH